MCGYSVADPRFGRFVAAMAFHYGLSWSDLVDMPVDVLTLYVETLDDLPPMGGTVVVQPRR